MDGELISLKELEDERWRLHEQRHDRQWQEMLDHLADLRLRADARLAALETIAGGHAESIKNLERGNVSMIARWTLISGAVAVGGGSVLGLVLSHLFR